MAAGAVEDFVNQSMAGRTALVTGGTDGIGKAIAHGLASRGAELFIAGSDAEKGARAERELGAEAGHGRVHFLQADLSLMRDTSRLADDILVRIPKLDRLVLCAGVVHGRRVVTAEPLAGRHCASGAATCGKQEVARSCWVTGEGVEFNFAVNYLSRFVLTRQLLPLLQAAGAPGDAARIVVIGGAARNGRIHYDDVNLTRNFGILALVRQFCQANDLFVLELARRLAESGVPPRVTVTTLKAGVVRTNIRRGFPWWMKALVTMVFDPLVGQAPEQIAESAMRLLAGPEFEGKSGQLFTHIKRFKAVEMDAGRRGVREGQRLWEFSERLAARASSA